MATTAAPPTTDELPDKDDSTTSWFPPTSLCDTTTGTESGRVRTSVVVSTIRPTLAVTWATPAPRHLTVPRALTEARLGCSDCHWIAGFETTRPLDVTAVASNRSVSPTKSVGGGALSVSAVTESAGTEMSASPVFPSKVAVTTASPTATATTTPEGSTVATAAFDDCQPIVVGGEICIPAALSTVAAR